MTNFLYLVQIGGMDNLSLWKEFHKRVEWKQGTGKSYLIDDTTYDEHISIIIWHHRLDKFPIGFYEQESQLIHWRLVEKWLDENFPNVPRTNAINFGKVYTFIKQD